MDRKVIGVFIKDTHLSLSTIDINKSIFKQAKELCFKYECPLFHGGDIFTSRNSQPLDVLETFRSILNELGGVFMHVIDGNHDKTSLEAQYSYNSIFEKYSNVKVYSKEETVHFDNAVIHFLPYFKEDGSYIDRLKSLAPVENEFNLCLTHISVNGVRNNDSSLIENQVGKELFDKFDLTMVAHYHDESWIGNKIWYYPGAYQANFGENSKKGFTILYNDGSHDFIKSSFPEYIKKVIDIDDEKTLKQFEKEYANSTDHVRFVLKGDISRLSTVKKDRFLSKGIDIKFEAEEINTNIDQQPVIVTHNKSTLNDAFEKFCELNIISNKEKGIEYLNRL